MDASVVIATYNRAGLLARTLDSLADAVRAFEVRLDGVRLKPDATGEGERDRTSVESGVSRICEITVVDNNSTDEKARAIESRVADYPCPLRRVLERKQGKSFALNTGILASSGRIVVFTDDDVWIPPEWLTRAVEPLMSRPDIQYTGGPVFGLWEIEPPAWIHGNPGLLHGPLALVDYGPEPFIFEERRRIPMGVNMAVRRSLIDHVGGFHLGLERRGNSLMGQGQAEFFYRTRAAGARGLYIPEMWLKHTVPAVRLTREYYRRWWYWKGVARAQMQDLHPVTELGVDLRAVPSIAGIPRFMWGDAARDAGGWLAAALRRDAVRRAEREMALVYFAGYLSTRRAIRSARRRGLEPQPARSPRDSSAAPVP
jgi:glycosyltransferase involved in cell wall biosynthesis